MNLANKITIIRIILTPFFILSVAYGHMKIALVLFVLAVFSDGIDGFIARTQNQKTQLGTILDPIADKLLLVSAFICLSLAEGIPSNVKLPPYVPIIAISRDAIIVVGSMVVYFIKGSLRVSPSIIGKITTFFQMITIIGVLVLFEYTYVIWNITVGLVVISGIDYIIKGSRLLNENNLNIRK